MYKIVIAISLVLSTAYFCFALNVSRAQANPKTVEIHSLTANAKNNILENIEERNTPREMYGLVNLNEISSNFCIELRYASRNNFTGKQIYPHSARAFLQKSTAEKLLAANEELYELGYRIKILDAYRPRKYQYILREAAYNNDPATAGFVANPDTGSHHNRGASIDITLTDLEGHELNMPTEFDFFGPEASIYYDGCTDEQKENRELLGKTMEKHGFRRISSEWWHFDDVDYANYELLDVDFNELSWWLYNTKLILPIWKFF